LALERKKIQQQLSRSHLQFVPVPVEKPEKVESKERRDSEGNQFLFMGKTGSILETI